MLGHEGEDRLDTLEENLVLVSMSSGKSLEETSDELEVDVSVVFVRLLLDVDGQKVNSSHLEVHHLLVSRVTLLLLGVFLSTLYQLRGKLSCLAVVGTCAISCLLLFIIHKEEVTDLIVGDHNVHLNI